MSSMPVVEPMTAQEYVARPYDPGERGWELIGGELIDMHDFRRSAPDAPQFDVALELTRDDTLTSPLLPGLRLAVGAIFG
jgi:hypothetical protein